MTERRTRPFARRPCARRSSGPAIPGGTRVAWLLLAGLAGLAACSGEPSATTGPATPPGLTGMRYLSDAGAADDGFARALEPRAFRFPADHAPHPAFRTEWWYFTGNVFDADGRHYGFELTFFRVALAAGSTARESRLAADQVWLGNLAVTDTRGRRFRAAERLSRGADGIAGVVSAAGESPRIAIEDWSIAFDGNTVALAAADAAFGIELELSGLDRILRQGDAGLDPKGPEPGNASYYFSAPRLAVTGLLQAGDSAPVAVTGQAWMDREWSTSALSPELDGWDWFALQLDDGRDLMFYRLRGQDGATSPFSGGAILAADGTRTRLGADDVSLEPTRHWTSPATGVRYPVAWQMAIPSAGLALEIRPRMDDQELDLSVRYWEGAVTVTGRTAGTPIGGLGYLELAGY